MNYSDSDINEAFFLLDKLGDLSEVEIEDSFSDRNSEILKILAIELCDQYFLPENISPNQFSKSISELRAIKRKWGVRLGNLMIDADDKMKNGEAFETLNILEQFVKTCTSPFHRRHARNQLEYYRSLT